MFVIQRKDCTDGPLPTRLSGYGGFNIASSRPSPVHAAWLKLAGPSPIPTFAAAASTAASGTRRPSGPAGRTRSTTTSPPPAGSSRPATRRPQARLAREQQRRHPRRRHRPAGAGSVPGRLLPCAAAGHDPVSAFGIHGAATVEFGSPDDPVEGAYLAGYSPYHNVRPGVRYPAMAFVPAMNDKLAPPYDPVKMVARMQAEAPRRAVPVAAAARLRAWWRHHAGGGHRAGCRRTVLLRLGARRHTVERPTRREAHIRGRAAPTGACRAVAALDAGPRVPAHWRIPWRAAGRKGALLLQMAFSHASS